MSDSVDLVLKLVDRFSGPTRAATSALGKFYGAVGSSVGYIGKLNAASEAAKGKVTGLHSAGSMAFSVLGGNLLSGAVAGMGQLAIAAAGGAYHMATFGQNTRLAFDALAKYGADGGKVFRHARDLAVEFGLDVQDTSKQYSKFLALQFNPDQADNMIKMGADLRALGNDAESVKGVFLALGQIKSKGRLQAQEMLQLQERGVAGGLVKEEIAKLMGVAVSEVDKLQEAGKVSAEIGLAAIESAINRKLGNSKTGEAGKRFAENTIDGMVGQISATAEDVGITLMERLTPGFTRAADSALTFFQGFLDSEEGAATMDAISDAVGKVADMMEWLVPIGLEALQIFGGEFAETFSGMSGALAATSDDGGQLGHTILEMAKVAGMFFGIAAWGAQALYSVTAAVGIFGLALVEAGIGAVQGFFRPFIEGIGNLLLWWDDLSALWDDKGMGFATKAWEIGKHIVGGLAKGIWAAATLPFEAIIGVVDGVIEGSKKALGINSPSKVFYEMGEYSGEGYALGLRSSMSANDNAVPAIGAMLSDGNVISMQAGARAASGGGASSRPIHISLTVNVYGSTGEADDIARRVRSEVYDVIEQLADQIAA